MTKPRPMLKEYDTEAGAPRRSVGVDCRKTQETFVISFVNTAKLFLMNFVHTL
jgi:hypothetical protein